MHTVIVLSVGFVLLTACMLVGHAVRGRAGLAKGLAIFLPLWLLGAIVDMSLALARGHSRLADTAPVFLLAYAVPASVALVLRWRLR